MIRPFYRKNAGQLVLIFILFIGAVGELEGSQIHTGPIIQLHYQYQLILGMLSNRSLFLLVLLAWLAYAEKCTQFMLSTLQREDHIFLNLLNRLSPGYLLRLLFRTQMILFLSIGVYSIAILGVAAYKGWWWSGLSVAVYVCLVCLLTAIRVRYRLLHPDRRSLSMRSQSRQAPDYAGFLLRYIWHHQKLLVFGIKVFSCGILYFTVRTLRVSVYDIRMPAVLSGIGMLGQGILVYQLRSLEESALVFYRGLSVTLWKRSLVYTRLYFLLLAPEMLVLLFLTPYPMHVVDAIGLLLSGYGLLLLLNSLLFTSAMPIKEMLQIVFCLFLRLYFAVLAGWLLWLGMFSVVAAGGIFHWIYYRYDAAEGRS
jgi:hypothetical protein